MKYRVRKSDYNTYYYAEYRTMFWPFWRSCRVDRFDYPEKYYTLRDAENACKGHQEWRKNKKKKKNPNITYVG